MMSDLQPSWEYVNAGAGRHQFPAKQVSHIWKSRKNLVMLINFMVSVWYFRFLALTCCRNLEDRLIYLWMPLSTINLYIEHAYGEIPYDCDRFLRHALMNSYHYVVGYAMFKLPLWFCLPLVVTAMCEYTYLCYQRYFLSETKMHKYSLIFEAFISITILPMFLVTDLVMKHPPHKQFFWPYAFVDAALKIGRTTFTYIYRDEFLTDPLFNRQESWSRGVSENSILDFVSNLN